MYLPDKFNVSDTETITRFINDNPFATIITANKGIPNANHIPLLLEETTDGLRLLGHVAKSNEQWQDFKPDHKVLAIFQGPHSYISPTWYQNPGVPTWNYTAVHVLGSAKLITDDPQLKDILSQLSHKLESGKTPAWNQQYSPKLLQAIVGFEIYVEDIQAKYKLSQNRSTEDQKSVVQQLRNSDTDNAQHVASLMQQNLPKGNC